MLPMLMKRKMMILHLALRPRRRRREHAPRRGVPHRDAMMISTYVSTP